MKPSLVAALLLTCVLSHPVFAALPPAGVSLIPHGAVFKSIADFEYSILVDEKSHQGGAITSAELEIRNANIRVARMPYRHELGYNLKDERALRAQGSRQSTLSTAKVVVDGVERQREGVLWTGPVGLISNGQRWFTVLYPLENSRWVRALLHQPDLRLWTRRFLWRMARRPHAF